MLLLSNKQLSASWNTLHYFYPVEKAWSKTWIFDYILDICDFVCDKQLQSRHTEARAACRKPCAQSVRIFDQTDQWNIETTGPPNLLEPDFCYLLLFYCLSLFCDVARVLCTPYLCLSHVYGFLFFTAHTGTPETMRAVHGMNDSVAFIFVRSGL